MSKDGTGGPGVLCAWPCEFCLGTGCPPDGGRRARYGKLRFPSCAPFHPPGAHLPQTVQILKDVHFKAGWRGGRKGVIAPVFAAGRSAF